MKRSRQNKRLSRAQVGRWGERIAAFYLRLRGYRLLARNLRVGGGELDLVVWRPGEIRVIEVRTVRGRFFECPSQAVGPAKQQRVLTLTQVLATQQGWPDGLFHCDIVGIRLRPWRLPEVVWLRDALEDRTPSGTALLF